MNTLKKLSIALVLICAMASCSKSDDTVAAPTNAELVIGLWQLQSATQDGNPVVLGACELAHTIRFTEAGMLTQTFYSGTNCSVATPTTGTYTINGDSITANSGSSASIVRIVSITSTSFSVEFDESGILVVNNYIKS